MKDRIKQLRQQLGLNQTDFGAKIGIKQSTVASYERGNSTPMDGTIKSICREFGVREEWLRTGTGPMTAERPRDEVLATELEKILTAGSDDFRRNMISILVRMPPDWWGALEDKARELLADASATADTSTVPHRTREQEADEVADRIREEIRNGGEKASESGPPPAGAGIA